MGQEITWSETWNAFGPLHPADPLPDQAVLATLPAALAVHGRSWPAQTLRFDHDVIDLARFFKLTRTSMVYVATQVVKDQAALLFTELAVPQAGQLLIGAGADWWMQWFLDGTCVYDTLTPDAAGKNGNGTAHFGITNHAFTVDLTPGRHVLAVRVVAGSAGWSLTCACGRKVHEALQQDAAAKSRPDYGRLIQEERAHAQFAATHLSEAADLLPAFRPAFPGHDTLAAGALKVRLIPGTTTPTLVHYITKEPAANVIRAVQQHQLADSWAVYGQYEPYIKTGWPLFLCFKHNEILQHRIDGSDPELANLLDHLETVCADKFFSFQIGEWSNYFNWDLGVFFSTPEEIPQLDRSVMFQRVQDTFKSWKRTLRGHLDSVNGFGLIPHIGAELGEDFVGIETGENIPCAQVQRAFARGAARQFSLPWGDQISQWYEGTVPSGVPCPLTDMTPGGVHPTFVGEHTGHSLSLLTRMWFTSWFAGAAAVNIEAATGYLFDVPYHAPQLPDTVGLSAYGRWAQKLFALMKNETIGVPYTPFAVLVSKCHGRMTSWGDVWRRFKETAGDEVTVRFFDQLFPGQSRGPGYEQRYLCPSPFGDTFDVLVNDAERSALNDYPVILAVGDLAWTLQDLDFLKDYVRAGGILCLNELHLNGWDRRFLGLDYTRFAPIFDAQPILMQADGSPRLIRRHIGKGMVWVAARKPELTIDEEMAFPNALLRSLAERFLPFQVAGAVQTLINRTPAGWAVMVVNHQGFYKAPLEKPVIDPAATQSVRVSWSAGSYQVAELLNPQPLAVTGQSVSFRLPPGEFRILTFKVRV